MIKTWKERWKTMGLHKYDAMQAEIDDCRNEIARLTAIFNQWSEDEILLEVDWVRQVNIDCIAHYEALKVNYEALRKALEQATGELADGVINCERRIKELIAERDALKADAERYQWLIDKMQASYDGDEHEVPGGFSVYCNMLSAWRTERIVRAEINWRDKRDEQLGLSAAIDAARAALGETS